VAASRYVSVQELFDDLKNPQDERKYEGALKALVYKDPRALYEHCPNLSVEEADRAKDLLALHKRTPPDILDQLEEEIERSVWIARNPNTSPATLERLSLSEIGDRRLLTEALLSNRNTPPAVIDRLAHNEAPHIRSLVAEHPRILPPILDRLAKDQHVEVRWGVARNPNASPELLDRLSRDKDTWVRRTVARHPNASPGLLDRLSMDEDGGVRQRVAENPYTSPAILKRLAFDKDQQVVESALQNPSLPDTVRAINILGR